MLAVKICGICSVEDAVMAWQAGADAIGMIFADSPRRVAMEEARRICAAVPPWVVKVGVFVNAPHQEIENTVRQVGLQAVQLHGDEDAATCARFAPNCIKVLRPRTAADLDAIPTFPVSAILLDTFSEERRGGTGQTMDWSLAQQAVFKGVPLILSGGLRPNNVEEAVRLVRPAAVDVSSGVEFKPGRKDQFKTREFIRVAKVASRSPWA